MAWPTTNDPRTEFVTVRFTVAEEADIRWLMAVVNAKDRSAAVRQCVDRVVAAERRRHKRAAHKGGEAERRSVMEDE